VRRKGGGLLNSARHLKTKILKKLISLLRSEKNRMGGEEGWAGKHKEEEKER